MHNKFASAFDVAVVVLLAVSGLAWLRWGERYGAEGPPLSSATIAPQLAYACAAYTRPPLTGHVNLHAPPPPVPRRLWAMVLVVRRRRRIRSRVVVAILPRHSQIESSDVSRIGASQCHRFCAHPTPRSTLPLPARNAIANGEALPRFEPLR